MSPGPLSHSSCTTGGAPSRRWTVAALLIAMVGFAGAVFADATASPHGTKVVQDSKSKAERLAPVQVDDATGQAIVNVPARPNSQGQITPLAPPSNDDVCGATVLPDGPYPFVTAPEDVTD